MKLIGIAIVFLMAAASVCAQPTPIKVGQGLSPASHMVSVGAAFAQTLCAKAPGKFKVELFPSFALGGERQMLVNLALGMITPPFGVSLFAACSVAKISDECIIPEIIRFVIVVFGCLMVITYFPPLSLFLRDLVYH